MFRVSKYSEIAVRRILRGSRPLHRSAVVLQQQQGHDVKRPLEEAQLKGTTSTTDTTTASAKPPSPTSGGGNGGGSSTAWMAFTALAAGGVAAGYYYYDTQLKQQSTADDDDTDNKETTTTKEDETSTSTQPHRVTQIQVENMQNTASAEEDASAPSSSSSSSHHRHHPVDGHRVLMTPAGREGDGATTALETDQALAALQTSVSQAAAEALLANHPTMWAATSGLTTNTTTMVAADDNLDTLSDSQLKGRIVQLATELKERTKWEALRLKEFLAMKEQEVSAEYTKLLQKQRLEFEDLLAQRLREQEHALRSQLEAALREKDANIQSLLDAALEAQKAELQEEKDTFVRVTKAELQQHLEETYARKMQEYKDTTAADLQEKVATLQALGQKVTQLQDALSNTEEHKQGSAAAHRLSAAALNLSEKLATHKPAGPEIRALQAVTGEGGVIATAVAAIPAAVHTDGVATLAELQTWFEDIFERARQAALVPAGRPGLEGQLAGRVLAMLKFAPQPRDENDDEKSPESADDVEKKQKPQGAEFILAKARRCVQKGDLTAAVEWLDTMPAGQAKLTLADWKSATINRILVDKAVKVIKMECALLNESLVD